MTFSERVNAVGVEVNTASKQLLAYVSGLNATVAENIVRYRNANGPFKRRRDLIPNLVETVKGYAAHESQTFEKTTKARAEAMAAQGVGDTAQAEAKLSQALAELRAVAENYPTLRATENFQQLSRNLSELEDEIQASRRIYNSNVQSYNTDIQQFPGSIIANAGDFEPREFFEIEDAAQREPVSVSFND